MKFLMFGIIALGLVGLSIVAQAEPLPEKHMVVVICSYNNKDYYRRNLGSALCQFYKNYHVVYINDVSSDGTGELVEAYIRENNCQDRVTLINNSDRIGAMGNLYAAIHNCSDTDIVVTLDGDDWFAHDRVLERINQEYARPDVWLTYGQFCYSSGYHGFAVEIPQEFEEKHLYRKCTFVSTHPRTFYAWLFKRINKEDLLYEGKFYAVSWDLAMMYPMLEMAGKRAHFIPDYLYIYNAENPINDNRVRRELMVRTEQIIRHLPCYERLSS